MIGYDRNDYFLALGNQTLTFFQLNLQDILCNKNYYTNTSFSGWTWIHVEIDTRSSNLLISRTTFDGNVHIANLTLQTNLLKGNNSTLSVGIANFFNYACNCQLQLFRVSFPKVFKTKDQTLLLKIDYIGKKAIIDN